MFVLRVPSMPYLHWFYMYMYIDFFLLLHTVNYITLYYHFDTVCDGLLNLYMNKDQKCIQYRQMHTRKYASSAHTFGSMDGLYWWYTNIKFTSTILHLVRILACTIYEVTWKYAGAMWEAFAHMVKSVLARTNTTIICIYFFDFFWIQKNQYSKSKKIFTSVGKQSMISKYSALRNECSQLVRFGALVTAVPHTVK